MLVTLLAVLTKIWVVLSQDNYLSGSTLFNETSSSNSLVARVGQIITLIILVGVISLISSMLVTESLSGDAAKINSAGALRMQAIRISRAYLLESEHKDDVIAVETKAFEQRLSHLLKGGLLSSEDNNELQLQYKSVVDRWSQLKKIHTSDNTLINSKNTLDQYDQFVVTIDKLVTLLQIESEKKLSLLRLIQGISLLTVLIISIVIMNKVNKLLIVPLKQLVNVANETGKGNFDLKAQYNRDDELGVLSRAINKMSNELKSTYQDFEQRVNEKTKQLTQTNQSLEMLFHAAKQLTTYDSHAAITYKNPPVDIINPDIIYELEHTLGVGKVHIEMSHSHTEQLAIDVKTPTTSLDTICFNNQKFPLEKQNQLFGFLVWQFPHDCSVQPWQQQILQAMADIIATAIELDQKRNSDNRLLIVEERAVIARELHDSLAQSLSYLKFQMSLLTKKMQKKVAEDQLNETITDIKNGLNNAYLQLRELLTTFRLKLDDPSLANSIQGTVAEFKEKCQHPISLDYHLPDNYLNANQEIHLLQIIREALSNIHRHAHATEASIHINHSSDSVNIDIIDNGQGVPATFTQQGHFGLGIMEERAKSLNSLVSIDNIEPHGTKVSLRFNR